ncbi:MAG: tRNA (adenosine(37)-N6)-threonylcarbamoyltransferase complex ATPase subunit type 1 TsaE [Bacteroidia bacterium]
MEHIIEINHIDELSQAAKMLLATFPNEKVFAFYAPMGAGKTTFIKSICKALGINDTISSPTFSLVNEYVIPNGTKAYHFDFYRIKSTTEAYDMGYEDYLYSNAYCFIEWPEKIEELLPEHYVKIKIDIVDTDSRIIKLQKV